MHVHSLPPNFTDITHTRTFTRPQQELLVLGHNSAIRAIIASHSHRSGRTLQQLHRRFERKRLDSAATAVTETKKRLPQHTRTRPPWTTKNQGLDSTNLAHLQSIGNDETLTLGGITNQPDSKFAGLGPRRCKHHQPHLQLCSAPTPQAKVGGTIEHCLG